MYGRGCYLTDGNGYYFHSGACGLVEPEDYDTEYISALLETRRGDGTTWRDYLNDGQGALVKATFEAELTPEAWYLGKQYGEGRFHVYLIAPFDEAQPVRSSALAVCRRPEPIGTF